MALLKTDPGDIVAIPSIKAGIRGFVLSRIIAPEPYGLTEVFSGFHTNFGMTEEQVLEQDFSVVAPAKFIPRPPSLIEPSRVRRDDPARDATQGPSG